MKQFLLNLWNAQKNAEKLCALEPRHKWLVGQYKEVSENLDAMESERSQLIN